MSLPRLEAGTPYFPDPATALDEPNGLLAAGGELSPDWLVTAYRQGIFPWYEEGQPVLWWSPTPRLVLEPQKLHVSRSLAKRMRRGGFEITADRAFEQVIDACGGPRAGSDGTWITPAMRRAYCELHRLGIAHSVEVWTAGSLLGGLYGIALGKVFFGESMFSHGADGSKLALVALCRQLQRWGFQLIDCQVETGHLQRMGAQAISREDFLQRLASLIPTDQQPKPVCGPLREDGFLPDGRAGQSTANSPASAVNDSPQTIAPEACVHWQFASDLMT
jgi:leucyl/phenylalanyl-tRNA--protein transferase